MPQPVTTPSPAGPVRLHAEIGAAVGHEHVELFKAALVQQQFHPLPRGQFALGVLRLDPARPTPGPCGFAPAFQLLQDIHASVPRFQPP